MKLLRRVFMVSLLCFLTTKPVEPTFKEKVQFVRLVMRSYINKFSTKMCRFGNKLEKNINKKIERFFCI